jgi:hypothetical protein
MWGGIAAAGVAVFVFAGAPHPVASAEPAPCATVVPPPAGSVFRGGPVGDRLVCADLRGMDLTQANLAEADLHGADLRDANLTQAHLTGADLTGANLTGADLGQADLQGAVLTDAVLRGADLSQAYLTGADARGADFADADLIQADLRAADLRGADLRGADLTQAEVDDLDLRGADLADVESLAAGGVRLDAASIEGNRQIAWLVFWPALVIMLNWWRARIAHLSRHRTTTPVRPAEVVVASAAVVFAVGGGYLLAVGAARGLARLSEAWLPTIDPGPLAVVGADPVHQLVSGGTAVAIAMVLFPLARLRRSSFRRAAPTGQVVIGERVAVGPAPAVSRPVRPLAVVAAMAGAIDLVVMVSLKIAGELPADGLWSATGFWGHVATVALATIFLTGLSWPDTRSSYSALASLSGVVLAGSGRAPYVLASGKTETRGPVSRVLPWDALTHVHLIRTLGTPHATRAMVTLRQPGATGAIEHREELPITVVQLTRLREMLPPDMLTEVVRAPPAE